MPATLMPEAAEQDLDLMDLDLDLQAVITGGLDAPLRPEMFTFVTCDTGGSTGTSCEFTNHCNPMCC